jgi:protease I
LPDRYRLCAAVMMILILVASCGETRPTATDVPPTGTPSPSDTPVPPTKTPVPPTKTPIPPTATATPAPTNTVLLIFGNRFIYDIYSIVRPALEEAGYDVVVASRRQSPIRAKTTDKEVMPDLLLEDVQVTDYDAIVFTCDNDIGFGGGRPETDRIAQEAVEQDKVLAAICNAPMVLGYAGVVEGVAVTGEPSKTCKLLEALYGATCTNATVERDGLIITARDRYASRSFVQTILEVLQEQ